MQESESLAYLERARRRGGESRVKRRKGGREGREEKGKRNKRRFKEREGDNL